MGKKVKKDCFGVGDVLFQTTNSVGFALFVCYLILSCQGNNNIKYSQKALLLSYFGNPRKQVD